MKRAIVLVLVVAQFVAPVAVAAPHQVLVMRAEGTADAATRTSVDSHVLRLAKHIDGKVEEGEITLTEAAAAVGCNPGEATCKDDLLATLGVDEIVATTVTATPTGFNVTVRRISRGDARAAQTTLSAGTPPDARLDTDIGPLFGVVAAAPPPDTPVANTPAPQPQTTPAVQASPAEHPEAAQPPPALAEPAPIAPTVTAAPNGAVTQPAEGARNRRLPKIGMAVGGGLVLLGFLMWGQASDVQGEIDDLDEPRTPTDFRHLRDLEREGDDAAGAGNFFFLTGAVLGGVSAYFYWRAGKTASTQTARIAPAAFPGGAGVTLTVGGMP